MAVWAQASGAPWGCHPEHSHGMVLTCFAAKYCTTAKNQPTADHGLVDIFRKKDLGSTRIKFPSLSITALKCNNKFWYS